MPLATLPNLFDNQTHAELDNLVVEDVKDDLADADMTPYMSHVVLLSGIIARSKCSLDKKNEPFGTMKKLLKTHEELGDMLMSAWERKSFRDIRNLAILRVPEPEKKQPTTAWPYHFDDLHIQLSISFKEKYYGAAVEGFREYLRVNQRRFRTIDGPKYYAKACSVVQSSGTGKSRMLTELGRKDVVVIFMNIRGKQDKLSFPIRDQIPSKILTGFPSEEGQYRVVCYAFFVALFDTLEEYLTLSHDAPNTKASIKRWVRKMCDLSLPPDSDTRDSFFEKLSEKYNKVHSDFLAIYRRVQNSQPTFFARTNIPHIPEFTTRLLSSFKRMTACLRDLFPNDSDEAKLVIAFDEAHTLFPDLEYLPRDILCRVISEYSHHEDDAVWVVFASTTPSIADLSPVNQTRGAAILGTRTFEPYTSLGWDQSAPGLGEIDAEDVSKLDHILGYGRPLWLSIKTSSWMPGSVLNLAQAKLCGGEIDLDARKKNEVLAVLGQRFGLDLAMGHPGALEYLEKGVASHLRIYHSRTLDHTWMFTSYPSEPLLSCMATFVLHDHPDTLPLALRTLMLTVDAGLIDVGRPGELASRLLWSLAKDLFVRKRTNTLLPRKWDASFADCQMMPVTEWLEFVFGPRIWNDQGGGSRARDALNDAYVNFSHWIRMEEIITGSSSEREIRLNEWTLRHWQRTSAVQCYYQQPVIDKVIPIYFTARAGPEGASAESRTSHVLVADRVSASRDSKHVLEDITRLGGDEASAPDAEPLPYVAIVADFGQPPSLSVTYDDRCLRIYAAGVDVDTYPFLAEHPRLQVVETLRALVGLGQSDTPYMEYVGAQAQFGSSSTAAHMAWERGQSVPKV